MTKLIIENSTRIDNPTKADIRALFSAKFAVLEKSTNSPSYMQFMKAPKGACSWSIKKGPLKTISRHQISR